jgi:hypothetical protein
MESLWPKFEEQELEQNDSIQILRDQARAIKSETNGVVRATFSKMNYKLGLQVLLKHLVKLYLPCHLHFMKKYWKKSWQIKRM